MPRTRHTTKAKVKRHARAKRHARKQTVGNVERATTASDRPQPRAGHGRGCAGQASGQGPRAEDGL